MAAILSVTTINKNILWDLTNLKKVFCVYISLPLLWCAHVNDGYRNNTGPSFLGEGFHVFP